MSLSERDRRFLRRYISRSPWRTLLFFIFLACVEGFLAAWQAVELKPVSELVEGVFAGRVLMVGFFVLSVVCSLALVAVSIDLLVSGRRLRRILNRQLVEKLLDQQE